MNEMDMKGNFLNISKAQKSNASSSKIYSEFHYKFNK